MFPSMARKNNDEIKTRNEKGGKKEITGEDRERGITTDCDFTAETRACARERIRSHAS